MKHKSFFLLVFLLALASCVDRRNSQTDSLLVKADSAFVNGRYEEGDSLLSYYDSVAITQAVQKGAYRDELELMKLFVNDKLSERHFKMADSLSRYYKQKGDEEHYIKSLLFVGDIYRNLADYPRALNCFLEAEQSAVLCGKPVLTGLAVRLQGDVYFAQRIQVESIRCFRKSFEIAQACRDTLRLAHAAMRMGLAYTFESNVDSAMMAYRYVLDLGKVFPRSAYMAPIAKWRMSDIYIQTEEYEKAAMLMPYDSLNMDNWGYWHYGKNNIDSAIWYFSRTLDRKSLRGKSEILRLLVELEKKKGNNAKALNYSVWQSAVEDSIKEKSQVEETLRTQALHDISVVLAERDQLAKNHRWLLAAFILLLVILIALSVFLLVKKNIVQRAVRADHETGYDGEGRLRCDAPEPLRSSAVYVRLCNEVGTRELKLSKAELDELIRLVNISYNGFVDRLKDRYPLKDDEMAICCLVKIGVASSHIGLLLRISKGAVTMKRKRLCTKLLKEAGTPSQFNEFISSF